MDVRGLAHARLRHLHFPPRLIIGPGRLGILEKLFKLINYNLPVPMIGSWSLLSDHLDVRLRFGG